MGVYGRGMLLSCVYLLVLVGRETLPQHTLNIHASIQCNANLHKYINDL